MRVFVTGATGWVGSMVVADLLAAGHTVLGLARSGDKAAVLAASGAQVLQGTLDDLEALRDAAAGADAVIHTAFDHDFSKMAENSAQDAAAITAMGDALIGSERPIVVTSGVANIAPGRTATESDAAPVNPVWPRRSEVAAAALIERGVCARVVRLAPSVHGVGDHGFVPVLIALARQTGVSAYIGYGANRWTAVHRRDTGALYRRAVEFMLAASGAGTDSR